VRLLLALACPSDLLPAARTARLLPPRRISEAPPLIAGFAINVNRLLPTMAWDTAL
jgi:hypothetical protein